MSISETRMAACRSLTRLIAGHRPFSFLRLGDGEVAFMLCVQEKRALYQPALRASCEVAYDGPGIEERHYPRLRRAYEECTYLDYHDNIPINIRNLPHLDLARKPGLWRNESPATATLIFDWTYLEFGGYLAGRKCLLAGSEATLLRELYLDPAYRDLAKAFWPADAQPFFHQVRGNGHALSANLDLIKADLAALITEHGIDTLFLCLGGAAKIICHELSQELHIRAIDWGSMMRGLAYCGSAGFATWRASHSPYFVRVPFAMHMNALERAYPQLAPVSLIAKAHAQLCLELQRKELMRSFAADAIDGANYDPQPENLRWFAEARETYERRYRPLAQRDPEARQLVREFDYWCLKKGLGWRGRMFLSLVDIKQRLRGGGRAASRMLSFTTGRHRLTPGRALYLVKAKFGNGLRAAYYRDAVAPLLLETPPCAETDDPEHEIHVLTSDADWLILLWALRSFYHFSKRRYALCVHNDGTLTEDGHREIQRMFPNARIITRGEADRVVEDRLVGFPRCRELRATSILSLKVFDFVTFLRPERMMLLDSDVLFFAEPKALLAALESPATTYNSLNRDWGPGYTIDPKSLAGQLGFQCPMQINSGLGLIHKASIRFDWIEEFLALPGILSHPHQIEQTLIALCSAKFGGFRMLPPEYDVRLDAPLPGAPSRHYTGPIRHLMYREGMRRLVKAGFLDQLRATNPSA